MGSTKRAAAALSVGIGALVAVSACSQQHSATAAPPTSSRTSSPSSSPSSSPGDHQSPHSGSAGSDPSQSPLAPSTIKPAIRDGVRPHPSISAAPASFDRSVTYPDGVKLTVTGVHQGRVSGRGPGVVSGPQTTFHLRFANGSNQKISLDQVVPTAEFGRPAHIASPVYDDHTQDFGTTVRPAQTATATYAFSIPLSELSNVTIHLDFDGRHYAATFHGSVRR